MIKAVFFDLYNTLLRYEPAREEVQAAALKDVKPGLTPDMLGRPLAAADEYIYGELARGLNKRSEAEKRAAWIEYERVVLRGLGIEPTEDAARHLLEEVRQTRSRLVLYDDVLPAFTSVRDAGLLIGLITNAERTAHDLMASLGLKPWLDVMVTSDEAGFSKPDPRIFRAALERAGVRAGEAVYVGDQYRIDVAGARSAGMTGILLDRGGWSQNVTDCPVIRTLLEITAQIAGL